MKVTLQVNGQEMTFSEQELTAIVEEAFFYPKDYWGCRKAN